MSVSLYDLLDVDESATAAEIRTAWKAAIADLDPTDRRFRAYNDAAGVLLDEDKRAAYDAELAAERGDDDAAPEEDDAAPIADTDEAETTTTTDDEPLPAVYAASGAAEPAEPAGPPAWTLFVAAGAAVLSLVLMLIVFSWPGSLGGESPADREEGAERAEEAAAGAVNAAAEAIPEILSYDYRTIDEDFAEAEQYLTDDLADKRSALFEQKAASGRSLRDEAVATKTVVTAAVANTGLTRVADSGDRATVVVFVNQDSQKGTSAPRPLLMWATVTMVSVDGDWLVDDLCVETDCG